MKIRSKKQNLMKIGILVIIVMAFIIPESNIVAKETLPSSSPTPPIPPPPPLQYPLLAVANVKGDPSTYGDYLWEICPDNGTMIKRNMIETQGGTISGIAFAPDNTLYGITNTPDKKLYKIDPRTSETALIGSLGLNFVREGGLAVSADGKAYGALQTDDINGDLFSINLSTGEAAVAGTLAGIVDINGLAFRDDGMLLAFHPLYPADVEILVINPEQFNPDNPPILEYEVLVVFEDIEPGGISGFTIFDDIGFFATGIGSDGGIPGSNELWRFDPYAGEDLQLIDSELVEVWSMGVTALTAVPEELLL